MRPISKPNFAQDVVFAACVQSIGDLGIKARCDAIAQQMAQQEIAYDQAASVGRLCEWVPHPRGENNNLAIGLVTRGELKGLYTNHMARAGKPARAFYDQLRMMASNNICPYCGIGSVETIDHFLPKGRYSSLSVLPLNLVPACRDCNTGKLDSIASMDHPSSHPYYEDQCVFDDEWLFAEIVRSDVVHVAFFVDTPIQWPSAISSRVSNHFSQLDLSRRYSIQAAGRLAFYASLIKGMIDGGAGDQVSTFLENIVQSEVAGCGMNSWQAALSRAVVNDFWFKAEGFQQIL